MPEDQLAQIARGARQYDFSAGETVFSKGAPGSYVYWVHSGRLRLTLTSPGGGKILHSMVEVGCYCGEISLLDGGLRLFNASADRRSHLIGLDSRTLLPALERNPQVVLSITRLLCEAIRVSGERIENLGLHNAETRIWSRLIHLSHQYGQTNGSNSSIRIAHGLSQQDLADSVGLTRVMVNRQLRFWREEKLTQDGRGFVVILDPLALEAFVWRRSGSK